MNVNNLVTHYGSAAAECSIDWLQIPAFELKWSLLSEPPQYETQGLLKSDVTIVETLR